MKYHAPEDVAKVLEIQPPTLRKYAKLLERYGYTFQKNKQGHRWYSDTDIMAFQKLIAHKRSGDMDLEAAAQAVLFWAKSGDVASDDINGIAIHSETERYSEDEPGRVDPAALLAVLEAQGQTIDRMAEQIRQQAEQNAAILKELAAIRGDMKGLNGPAEPRTELPPPPLQEEKRRRFWPLLFWRAKK